MNIDQIDLLREWITDRQYANAEDPVVSMVIERTSKKEYERKREELERQNKDEGEQERKYNEMRDEMGKIKRRKIMNVLTEYESESKSVEASSPELESEMMTMSCDPFRGGSRNLFWGGPNQGPQPKVKGEARIEGAKRPSIEGEARVEDAKRPRIEGEA